MQTVVAAWGYLGDGKPRPRDWGADAIAVARGEILGIVPQSARIRLAIRGSPPDDPHHAGGDMASTWVTKHAGHTEDPGTS
jgi:hypothetical protein